MKSAPLPNASGSTQRRSQRIASLDLFRLIAIMAVVVVHARPFGFAGPDNPKHLIATIIDLSCRFAVPYFFILSGFFFSKKLAEGYPPVPTFLKSARRLLTLYLGWGLLYLLDPFYLLRAPSLVSWWGHITERTVTLPLSNLNFFFEGTEEVMWFLPALVLGLATVAIAVHYRCQKYLPYVAIALYTIGLMWGSYSLLWSGSGTIDFAFNTRNGPFFGTLYVTLGWLISTRQAQGRWQIKGAQAIALIGLGLLLQIIEAKGLSAAVGVPFRSFDYLVGTVVVSVGLFSLALANLQWGKGWPILGWSQYTLGIYLIHNPLINALEPLSKR